MKSLAVFLPALLLLACSGSDDASPTDIGVADTGADGTVADSSLDAEEVASDAVADTTLEAGDAAAEAGDVGDAAPTYSVLYSPLSGTPDWGATTHAKLGTAAIKTNLASVFDKTRVQRLDVVIENANWKVMQKNLADLKAKLGGSPDFSTIDDPINVPCEVFYGGKEWYKVGIRFKGNSSLFNADSNKVPFKLKFSQFEAEYPAIAGQRFYGFKTLHLKSNYQDASEMHELVVDDLFRDYGLASPHASFYELWIDVGDGDGKKYFGLYTVVEDVEDTVIKTQYANSNGNLFKPEGAAAAFAAGSYSTPQFYLKTNEGTADFSDVKAMYDAINDTATFGSSPATWRTNLEKAFDAPRFVKWLAANTVLQDWDTYGVMTHNYYLYGNLDKAGVLEWIPWDNNEAMVGDTRCLPLDLTSTTTAWPLVYYPYRDPVYLAAYKAAVDDFASNHYSNAKLDSVINGYSTLIQSYVTSEVAGYTYSSATKFATAVANLKTQIAARNTAALAYAK